MFVIGRTTKVLSGVLATALCVASISAADIGSASSVALQCPSSETGVELIETDSFAALADNTIDISDYTYTLVPDLIIDTDRNYDGNTYLKGNGSISLYSDISEESDVITDITEGEKFIRISYGAEWSYIRTEDGNEGYVDNSVMDDSILASDFVPTATPTPTATPAPTRAPEATSAPTATPVPTQAPSVSETQTSLTVYATCSLNARSGPGISYSKISSFQTGDEINVVAVTDNGWYKTDAGYYVKSSYCSESRPTATPTPAPQATSETSSQTDETTTSSPDTSSDFASYVRQFIGVPYVYGGCSPSGLDCSGLVRYCYKTYYGMTLPHSARLQAQLGREVSASEISCGDIICFDYDEDGSIDHAGLYIGGNTVVHASNSRGQVVSVSFSSMSHIVTIRRVL